MTGGGEQTTMKVAVRVRPNNRREMESNQITITKVIDSTTILFDPDEEEDEFFFHGIKRTHRDITKKTHKKLSMEFDKVFGQDTTNQNVFEECTKPLVKSVMNGYNCSVFVYGATGAGKTFTMLGSESSPGITFLTMQELFRQITDLENTRKFDIGISYLEVYNELVKNLLTKSGPLKLREDSNGVVVSGLALKPIYSANQLLDLLDEGNKNRTQHPTDANAESSRSHAIFQVHIRMTEKNTGQKRTVKLSMIDLAGSERAASTKGLGLRFKEGASINKSLLALGNCINKLSDGLKHIPYRDSNLTRILKDSLCGNCQTLMIANVSPSSLSYEDTYNTLKYASRAKKIRTTVQQNVMKTNMPKDYYVKKVGDQINEIEKLKEIIRNLEAAAAAVASAEHNKKPELIEGKAYNESELQSWYRKIDAVYSALIKSQEYYFGMVSKEKILKLRTKLKSYAEEGKKILTFDDFKLNGDRERFEASIDRFGKQIEKQKEDLLRWSSLYKENLKDLKKLWKEIKESDASDILQIYMHGKDEEVKVSRQKIKSDHATKITSLYYVNLEHSRSTRLLSFEMIQRNYFLLKANKLVDTEFDEQLDKLTKMCCGHGIKFSDEQDLSTDDNLELSTLEFGQDLNDENDNNDNTAAERTVVLCSGKRERRDRNDELDSDTENIRSSASRYRKLFKGDGREVGNIGLEINVIDYNDFPFKHPGSKKAPVFDLDSTFNIDGNSNINNDKILKSILNENNVNASNREYISKALIKSKVSKQNITKTITLKINKENKKLSPGRICKSPRPIKAGTSSTFVRTNKTASLRSMKK